MKESNSESPENEVSTGKGMANPRSATQHTKFLLSVVPEEQDKKSDDPTAKVWSIYLSETAHYDAALVESWCVHMHSYFNTLMTNASAMQDSRYGWPSYLCT